jgi:hypothetical protein
MVNAKRILPCVMLCSWFMVAQPGYAQTSAPKVTDDKPLTFSRGGVRADNPRQPTPRYVEFASGLYTQRVLQAASPKGDYTVQVWSLVVSPGVTTAEAKLPGAAVLNVRAGSVVLLINDRTLHLESGATAAVPEGESLRFTNEDSSRPARLRAVVLSGNR